MPWRAPRTLARERRYVPPASHEARAQIAEQARADHLVRMKEVINKENARRRHGTEMLGLQSMTCRKRRRSKRHATPLTYHVCA